ncbi:MAG: diguanylate cyclase response regulator [Elusimicrobia bacterium]|nr:diguanylate cyclase response regulator [Elusimicrobiota bacterium]
MRPLNPIVKILLVEGNRDEAEILQDSFQEIQCTPILARRTETLMEALRIPAKTRIDLILLDLQLADSAGLETLKKMNIRFPKVPIVIFAESYDEKLAVKALHNGAQDYLIKSDVTIPLISRVIRYAIERQKLLSEVKALSLSDELTRLYNRRGFQILTEQQIKLSARRKKGACLIFADLDRLKAINDRFGHPEGDKALKDTARLLKSCFRKSDILARIGGDEFAALAIDSQIEDGPTFVSRIQNKFRSYNDMNQRPYKLSLSIGIAHYDPKNPTSLDKLLFRADKSMYQQKLPHHIQPKKIDRRVPLEKSGFATYT